jgi:predicted nucleic acid-binding protein
VIRVLPKSVCEYPDDDKFIAYVLAGKCREIVSGDRSIEGIWIWGDKSSEPAAVH